MNDAELIIRIQERDEAVLPALETKYGIEAKPATDLPAGIPEGYDFVLILGGDTQNQEN